MSIAKRVLEDSVLPDGPTALGHPTNEDLFAVTPVGAATSWLFSFIAGLIGCCPPVGRRLDRCSVSEVKLLLAANDKKSVDCESR